ncbi:copper resistance CopC family protein [Actinomadura oligospora]|uniref:copper resistance CopC family protein n=1 Tax=Actinomadura oligospora TaxID=111804 RepID=UPI0006856887|nr:copper resistance protein CopC [Actinomadura oligospora]
MKTSIPRRLGLLAALVTVLTTAFGALLTTPALAHTRLVGSTPGKNATAASVTEVKLVFSDRIGFAKVLVKDKAGKEYQAGDARRGGAEVTQKLTGPLPSGDYTVSYAVVGADGHRIEGSDLTFTAVGAQPTGGAPTAAPNAASPGTPPVGASVRSSPKAEAKESSNGAARWVMIGVGALLGIGIGVLIVSRAKRKHPSSGE